MPRCRCGLMQWCRFGYWFGLLYNSAFYPDVLCWSRFYQTLMEQSTMQQEYTWVLTLTVIHLPLLFTERCHGIHKSVLDPLCIRCASFWNELLCFSLQKSIICFQGILYQSLIGAQVYLINVRVFVHARMANR